MNVESLLVTRRCNQRCAFCTRVAPDSTDPSFSVLRDAIIGAASRGSRTVVLTGGEPLLRADLTQLVRVARAHDLSVVLETNATRISTEEALRLREAGVSTVRVSVVTTRAELHRSLVGDRTTPEHVFRGISACLGAGLAVRVRLPIGPGLPAAAARIAGLRRAYPAIERFELAAVAGADRDPDLAAQLEDAVREAARSGASLEVDADQGLLPCVHRVRGEAHRLFEHVLSREPGDRPNAACDACSACALAPRCTITAEQVRAAGSTPTPVDDARPYLRPGRSPGSRLHLLRAADVESFFHVDYEYGVQVERPTSRIGIVYRCNQVCTFCELADMDVDLPPPKVLSAIEASRRRGSRRLILTGGEPTLSPHLERYVAYARELGFETIELQTNAVLLDKPATAERLRAAGLTDAQVSLHGPDAARSDALTAAPGTHRRTLGGIDRLLAAGVRVLLNHLIFRDVAGLLLDFVDLVEKRWGAYRDRVTIQFHSPRNEFATREEALAHLPRYGEYAPMLRQAIERARTLGFAVRDLQDPTGIPSLCVLGADASYLGPIAAQAASPRLHRWEAGWMTRVAACSACDLAHACLGVPKHYVALYGEDEFRPIRLAAASSLPTVTDAQAAHGR
jgi:molybdenum cofactor biosynthesis enzyme MoaA